MWTRCVGFSECIARCYRFEEMEDHAVAFKMINENASKVNDSAAAAGVE